MIHATIDRPNQVFKVFAAGGALALGPYEASGDAWGDGNPADAPYGYKFPVAPGHYKLGVPQKFDAPDVAEGMLQIPVFDITPSDCRELVAGGKALLTTQKSGITIATIGGISGSIGNLARYGRAAVMIHGGGTNDGSHALDPNQDLCKTFGCTRLHNRDLGVLADYLLANPGQMVVFSVIGDPKKLSK